MRIDLRLPQLLAGLRVESKDVRPAIAEEYGITRGALAGDRTNRQRIPHDRAILKRPVDATRCGIQGIDKPVVASDKHTSSSNRGLCIRRNTGRKTEGPLQLQSRDLCSGQAGGLRRLESRIGHIRAPAVPCGSSSGIRKGRVVAALVRHVFGVTLLGAAERPAAHELGDTTLVRIR